MNCLFPWNRRSIDIFHSLNVTDDALMIRGCWQMWQDIGHICMVVDQCATLCDCTGRQAIEMLCRSICRRVLLIAADVPCSDVEPVCRVLQSFSGIDDNRNCGHSFHAFLYYAFLDRPLSRTFGDTSCICNPYILYE